MAAPDETTIREHTIRERRRRALSAGFDDHVAKPVQPDDLFDAIDRVWAQAVADASGVQCTDGAIQARN